MKEQCATRPDGTDKGLLVFRPKRGNGQEANRLLPEDRPAHEWYRFVLSFPPHLVREYLGRFGVGAQHLVLDPFCGTGTTLVEAKILGVPSVGVEANPMAHFASQVKVDWSPDPDRLRSHARKVAEWATERLAAEGVDDAPLGPLFSRARNGNGKGPHDHTLRKLPPDLQKLLLTNSISPLPLHKTLVLLDALKEFRDDRYVAALKLDQGQAAHVFYLVRAVSPGTYLVPPPLIEDMYLAQARGIGKSEPATIKVVEP